MRSSDLPPALLAAYRETLYRVLGEPPFVLQIGQASQALAALYRQHGQRSAAFITACNPGSQLFAEAENIARQQQLENTLAQQGRPWLPGIGEDPYQQWPGEKSCLVLGITPESALALGRQFGQNAIVYCGADAVPELRFC